MVRRLQIERYDRTRHYEDICYIAEHVQEITMQEIERLKINEFNSFIFNAVEILSDEVYLVRDKGRAFFLLGLLADEAVWSVATRDVLGYRKELLYYSRVVVAELLKTRKALRGIIPREEKTLRWLKWLGARVADDGYFVIGGE